jgi:hypothetical protein
MARVLTIYNCGTQFNRDQGTSAAPGTAGELIASLYDRTAHPDINDGGRLGLASYAYKLIHDGPGSAPGDFARWERNAEGVRELVQHPASESKAATPGLAPGKGLLHELKKAAQIAGGLALGSGWEANVANAVKVVNALEHKPEVVNLAGWSRGGITCHMIAHELYARWPEIPVNIFAVDPVPGGLRAMHGPEQLDIPPNVTHYCGVFAKHDRKIGFQAAVVQGSDDDGQQRRFYLMPGVHDTLVQGGPGLHAVAVLVDFLAARFLEAHGTAFSSRIRLSPEQICENYAIAKKTETQSTGKGQASYQGLAGQGGLNQLLGLGGRAPGRKNLPGGVAPGLAQELRETYFVNDHHKRAFRTAFPDVHRVAFQAIPSGQPVPAAELEKLKRALDQMKVTCRNSFEQLEKTGLAAYVEANRARPAAHAAIRR